MHASKLPPYLRCCLLLLFMMSLGVYSHAQQNGDVHIVPRRTETTQGPLASLDTHTKPFRADADLVLVPVTVTDPEDRNVTGLERDNFAIFENKQKETIASFSSEDAPISVGIIFDMSGSMEDKLEKARDAVVQFAEAANPQDEFFLIGFSDRPELLSDFSSDVGELQSKLLYARAQGQTALLDAIYFGEHQMSKAKHRRKALLIISDGGDNHSRYTESEVKTMVEEADVQIYGIGVFDEAPRTLEEREGPALLSDVADATGGRMFKVGDVGELPDVAAKIGAQLRTEYLIGYVPVKKPRDGKWHRIKVKLMPPKGLPPLSLYSKKGYYAPAE